MVRTLHHTAPVKQPRKKIRVRGSGKKSNPVPAILGFLVFLGGVGYAVYVVGNAQSATRAIRADYVQARADIEKAAVEKEADINARRQELAAQLKKFQTDNLDLKRRVQVIGSDLEKKQRELELKELMKNSISQRVSSQLEDKELVGESVEELEARLTALKNRKRKLMTAFTASYEALKSELNQLVLNGDPERLESFFIRNLTTVAAPAAGFFAGDAYYARSQPRKASELYKRVLQKFPDSVYAKESIQRLADVTEKKPFTADEKPGFFPYNVPDSLNTGRWQ
ncbi:MAG: hypothetical protein RRC34_05340 [Lentisphaeria bacterium]|nr:hypothetical protein [Lentisphaeria bacterium]